MKKDFEKLSNAADDELFKELGLTHDEAKTFAAGSRKVFGDEPQEPAEQEAPKLEIRPRSEPKLGHDHIRKA